MKNPKCLSATLRNIATTILCLFAVLVVAGCASTQMRQREINVTGKIPRPGTIWVSDFVADASDLPPDSTFAGQTPVTPPTEEEAALGRELGISIATQLAQRIRDMGMPAQVAVPGTTPQINDIMIRGCLVSIEQGSAAKRMTIGFGSGGSELSAAVEGFQMTATGLRKLGSGTIGAEGGKGPGASLGVAGWLITGNPVGLIVGGGVKLYGEASGSSKVQGRAKQIANEIADVLKERFQQQGWI
jgi:hypothetical protein